VRTHWQLPTSHDLTQLASSARDALRLGYSGVVLPSGAAAEDPWVTAAALAGHLQRLTCIVPVRPDSMSPTLAAGLAATLQGLCGGRLLLNVESGPGHGRRPGRWPEHDESAARADEFLAILRGAWSGVPLDYFGRHYRVAGATVATPPQPSPSVVYGDASALSAPISARHADVHLVGSAPPGTVAERIDRVRRYAAVYGREVSFGIRLRVISRDTATQAWTVTRRLLQDIDARTLASARERFRLSVPPSQQRLTAQHGGSVERLELYPNLWAGLELLASGTGLTLVGSHEQVAQRIEEYHSLGVDHFLFGGPAGASELSHGAEAEWFGEGVLPLLRRGSLVGSDARPLAGAAA
jgi:alkanesulfonate monooxygenase